MNHVYRQICYCGVTVHDKRKCNTVWANIPDSFFWILAFIMFRVNFLIYTSIFINAIQEGLTLKRLPLADSFLFVTSLPYLRSYPTLHCTGNWTSGAALWLTEMWTTYHTIHCKSGCGTVTDRDVREGFKFSLPLSAIPTHSPTLWSINWIFENIANIRYFQKNRWSTRCKRSKYQSSAQGMEGPQSTKGLYRSQGPYCPKCAHEEKPWI